MFTSSVVRAMPAFKTNRSSGNKFPLTTSSRQQKTVTMKNVTPGEQKIIDAVRQKASDSVVNEVDEHTFLDYMKAAKYTDIDEYAEEFIDLMQDNDEESSFFEEIVVPELIDDFGEKAIIDDESVPPSERGGIEVDEGTVRGYIIHNYRDSIEKKLNEIIEKARKLQKK
jgi:hypothetical protein